MYSDIQQHKARLATRRKLAVIAYRFILAVWGAGIVGVLYYLARTR